MKITAKTKLVGIFGWPLGHSLSPAMQNAAFEAAELDYLYLPLPVAPGNLKAALEGVKALGFAGVNITIPYKVEIAPLLDSIDRSAVTAGAINTVAISNGAAIGYNTDMGGFIEALKRKTVKISGCKAVVLGAGGAARAVVAGLIEEGAGRVTIAGRDSRRVRAFTELFDRENRPDGIKWEGTDFTQALRECDLLVNCTPLGMYPRVDDAPPVDWTNLSPRASVCDLVYNPSMTKFLFCAHQRGHKIVGGEGMLVEQGALAFELWTGRKAPRPVMYETLRKALNESG